MGNCVYLFGASSSGPEIGLLPFSDTPPPSWCVTKDPSLFILSFDLEAWHAHKRFCFSHHSSESSNSEIPSSVMSLRLLPLWGMCSLRHFATPISSARNTSISPSFWRNRFLTVLVHVVDLVICSTFHRYIVLSVESFHPVSLISLWRPIYALMSASSLRGSPLWALALTRNVTAPTRTLFCNLIIIFLRTSSSGDLERLSFAP